MDFIYILNRWREARGGGAGDSMSPEKNEYSCCFIMGKDNIVITGTSLKEIADELATLLYGKGIDECIGIAQNLSCSTFRKPAFLKVLVVIPEGKWVSPSKYERNYSYYIQSMITHAKRNGFHIIFKV
jgi:hypothetical protein